MRKNSTQSMGALHPVLFFMLVYGISLFLAIFVCRTVYYTMNEDSAQTNKLLNPDGTTMNATAYK